MVDLEGSLHLLGRHVVRRAHHLRGSREGRRRPHPGQFGQAEVRDLDLPVVIEQDVAGLDVAVHDALFVGVLQRRADLADDRERLARGQGARVDHAPQVRALDQLHGDVPQVSCAPEIVDGDDAGVREAGHGLGLTLEALCEAPVAVGRGRQDLDGDDALEALLARAVDGAHAAAADQALDLELGEQFRQLLGRRDVSLGVVYVFLHQSQLHEAARHASHDPRIGGGRRATAFSVVFVHRLWAGNPSRQHWEQGSRAGVTGESEKSVWDSS